MKGEPLKCWQCGTEMDESSKNRKMSFRAICEKCQAWQHCCKNCVNYRSGMSNDCLIPGTDPISDREGCNYCDEFVPKGSGPVLTKSTSDVSIQLFGSEEIPPKKNPKDAFGSLFKED